MREDVPARLLAGVLLLSLAACGEKAKLPATAGVGASPQIPAPNETLIPTVNIAPAKDRPAGTKPVAAAGLAVDAMAGGLNHPRWLYVLPNGDVLPGCRAPTASRCCATPTATAWPRPAPNS